MTAEYPPAPMSLPAGVADSHCHLDLGRDYQAPDPNGEPDDVALPVDEAVHRAAAVGVQAMIQVGIDVPSSRWAAQAAAEHRRVWATVALHPNEAPRIFDAGGLQALETAWAEIASLATRPEVRGVGETGMDFYRTPPEGRAVQEESFRRHIQIAKQSGKALVVHDREAHNDVLRIIDDEGAPDVVVLHCFSGDSAFARAASERGYYCSFAGVVTFKNAQGLRDAVHEVPAERMLVETDAPFLTPVPARGQMNSPYMLPYTVRALAELRNWELAETCELLMANTERAFGPL